MAEAAGIRRLVTKEGIDEAGFGASAKSLLAHGYLMPMRGKPQRLSVQG